MAQQMTLSKEGAMELIGHEAIVQTRYRDSVGVWTLGVGHTQAAGAPDPETYKGTMALKDVFALFLSDSGKYVAAVNAALNVAVTQSEFDALVSFHFNTGAIATASLTKSINAGDKKKAAEQFMSWSKPESIIGRRTKEQKLFAQGVYSNAGKATVYLASPEGAVQWKTGKSVDLAAAIAA
jgi:lysozyme